MVLLERSMVISLFEQQLVLVAAGQRFCYSVSTARNGPGQQIDSGCTPLGRHFIFKKIGAGLPVNTVFVGRKETGEVYSDRLALKNPQRDWILTRIIWLSGLEDGLNKGNGVDTKSRFIYIHGSYSLDRRFLVMFNQYLLHGINEINFFFILFIKIKSL